MTAIRSALLLLIPLAVATTACAQGAATQQQISAGTFGLVNGDGSEIITLDDVAAPAGIHIALCGDPNAYRVAYTRHQVAPPHASSRDIADNFANLPGDVLRVLAGHPRGDQTCYLTADSLLATTRLPLTRAGLSNCEPTDLRRIAAIKHRRVLMCKPMANAPPDVRVVAVQFAFIDTTALASIAVLNGTEVVFEDFPARYDGPETSTWRVDDGGVFSPRDFAILFLSRVQGTYVMGLTWAGAEGEDAFLLVGDSASAFRQAQMTYRYWSPE